MSAPSNEASGPDDVRERSIRLFTFLKAFTTLRTKVTRSLDKYEEVIWLDDLPRIPGFFCVVHSGSDRDSELWIQLKKPRAPKPPPPIPDQLGRWVEHASMVDPLRDRPLLREAIPEDPNSDEPQRWLRLADHSELESMLSAYVTDFWRPWAEENRVALAAQQLYNDFFSIHTKQQRLGEAFEVVLGIGLLTWKTTSGYEVRRHLLTAQTDVQFEAVSGLITVRAAAEGAKLTLEEDMLDPRDTPDVQEREVIESLLLDVGDDIFGDANVPSALKAWVNSVSANGVMDEASMRPGSIGPDPYVSYAPALILRRRSDRSIMRAMDEIIVQLKAGEPVPEGVRRFVEIQDDESRPGEGESEPGELGEDDDRLYFPLPANDEQMEIIRRLGGRQGVLVQGPPGTGKSHTIANLVCHLLAKGQRILITSHAARALEVLKDKIPEEVQALAVIVLGNDYKAMERLQSSVQGINDRYARWNPDRSTALRATLSRQLDERRATEAGRMAELRSLRERDTYKHPPQFGDYAGTEQEIAARIAAEEPLCFWIGPVPESDQEPPLTTKEAGELLHLFRRVPPTRDVDLALFVPDTSDLPAPQEFAALIEEEARSEGAWRELASDERDSLADVLAASEPSLVDAYARSLDELRALALRLGVHTEPWVAEALPHLLSGRGGRWEELKRATDFLIADLSPLVPTLPREQPSALEGKSLSAVEADARSLLERLESGKGLGFGPFRPGVVKRTSYIWNSFLDGRRCDSVETVQRLLTWTKVTSGIDALSQLWSGLTDLPRGTAPVQLADYSDLARLLGDVLNVSAKVEAASSSAASIDGVHVPAWHVEEIDSQLVAIEACTRKRAYQIAHSSIEAILSSLKSADSRKLIHARVERLREAVERRDKTAYQVELAAATKLVEEQRAFRRREELSQRLSTHLPQVAGDLAADYSSSEWDGRLADFVAAFNWSRADRWLAGRADPRLNARLQAQIAENRTEIARLTKELAAERAWASCLGQLSAHQRASLAAWQLEIKKIGKGTGKHAPRHRRRARGYMNECRGAIPAWIMPIYRVAETIEISPEAFDTIIVDEASQSGPEALFLQYLGKKMIVVGDDQQISPDNVGIDRADVALLAERYLKDVPLGLTFDADTSLFDHAGIRYPDKLALREHFRCMPEIIQFSNNLCYADRPLVPLRQFDASRVTPVLVTRHVTNGYVEDARNVNKPEAEALVAQIETCCADLAYKRKTFGVISLVGNDQAKYIERLLTQRIGAAEIEERKIVCGDAYAFQGDERDVMFLSLVQAPREGRPIGALATERDKRRFNVAASRARDQAWLFHTVTMNDLNRSGMAYKLLQYYLHARVEPSAVSGMEIQELRTRASDPRRSETDLPPPFGSWFEVDVFLRIVDRGFRVIPQYELAGKKIDLLVEGVTGRLAVECEGDRWHGEDRFDEDSRRQRMLERCGMKFSNIRGTAFYRDPDAALQQVWDDLKRLRIHASSEEDESLLSEEEASADDDAHDLVAGPPRASAMAPFEHPANALVNDVIAVDDSSDQYSPVTPIRSAELSKRPRSTGSVRLEPYVTYGASTRLPDPRRAARSQLVAGLIGIVEVEGPIVCERLLQTYVKSAGLMRVSPPMRAELLAALQEAKRSVLLEGRFEIGDSSDSLSEVVRLAGTDPVRPRTRGERTFLEVPPAEVGALMRLLGGRYSGGDSDSLFRNVLDSLDLRRMTGGIERALVAVHERYCRLTQLDAAPQTFTSPIEGGRSVSPAVSESLAPPSIDDLPPNAITPEGLARLEHEHEHIIGVTIPELMETRDPESDSRSRLEEAKRRVAELGNTIVDAHVVTPPTGTDYVYFGSIVRVSTPDGQEEYQVVGPAEAHSSEGRLNVMSGLGRAVYGHRVGDLVRVAAPAGEYEARILTIRLANSS